MESERVGRHRTARADGFSESYITYLSNRGEAYGYYSAFIDDNHSERRLFYYSREHGLHDLIDLIPELAQWQPLDPVLDGNSSGYVIGVRHESRGGWDSCRTPDRATRVRGIGRAGAI